MKFLRTVTILPLLFMMLVFLTGFKCNVFSGDLTHNPKPLAQKINSLKISAKNFNNTEIFKMGTATVNKPALTGYLNNSISFTLDPVKRDELLRSKPEQVTFKIPSGHGRFIELEMYKVKVTAEDFKSGELTGNGTVRYTNYEPGLYYRGIVKGDESSFASVSIFTDFVMAVFCDEEGNWIERRASRC